MPSAVARGRLVLEVLAPSLRLADPRLAPQRVNGPGRPTSRAWELFFPFEPEKLVPGLAG